MLLVPFYYSLILNSAVTDRFGKYCFMNANKLKSFIMLIQMLRQAIFALNMLVTLVFANKDNITLKIVGTDKFLGVTGSRFGPVNYHNALRIKLNTMDDISLKNLETNDNRAVTETGFWFFSKSYGLQKNKKKSSQSFRLVYYAPEEYLLMKGDNCLGFNSSKHLKRKSCKLGSAARFKICYSKFCESYFDIKKDLHCFTSMIGQTIHNLTMLHDPDRYDKYNNSGHNHKFDYEGNPLVNGFYPGKNKSNKMEESSDSDADNDDPCKSIRNRMHGMDSFGLTKPNFSGILNNGSHLANGFHNHGSIGPHSNGFYPGRFC